MDICCKFKSLFDELYANMRLTPAKSNTWNPFSNGILERIYQVLADGLRTFNLDTVERHPKI